MGFSNVPKATAFLAVFSIGFSTAMVSDGVTRSKAELASSERTDRDAPPPGEEKKVPQSKTRVPNDAAQEKAEAVIRDLYKVEYAENEPAAMRGLTGTLLRKAAEMPDDPTGRFVLLREARDLAARSGDVGLAFRAVDRIAEGFEADPFGMKTAVLTAMVRSAKTAEELQSLAEAGLDLSDEAMAAGRGDDALRLSTQAQAAAKKARNPSLATRAQARTREYRKVQAALQTLKTRPDSPEANAAVGKFHCFVTGDWDKGVPYLGKGDDPKLKAVARAEGAKPSDPAAQETLADSWWDLAGGGGQEKASYLRRALYWYQQSLPGLSGLSKEKVGRRVQQLRSQFPDTRADEPSGELRRFSGHTNVVWWVSFSPDGKRALSGSDDGTARLWDVESGRELRRMDVKSGVTALAFLPDGRRAIFGCRDGTVRLWDVVRGGELGRLTGQHGEIHCVAASRDGSQVVCAPDQSLWQWDLAGGQVLNRFEGHAGPIWRVALSRYGRSAISSGSDRTARVWDLAAGTEYRRIELADSIHGVAFSPDGRHVLTGCADTTVRLWDVSRGRRYAASRAIRGGSTP